MRQLALFSLTIILNKSGIFERNIFLIKGAKELSSFDLIITKYHINKFDVLYYLQNYKHMVLICSDTRNSDILKNIDLIHILNIFFN